ncbi:hypothetical protein G6F65_015933 [Rhizopus arrhizus]|nr:hypothetical protein G6F32_014029 [Rhizopus arrhizus]KAG1257389.1 hypothetical protein G6F65_015933 [Rhizopus arrhizus]
MERACAAIWAIARIVTVAQQPVHTFDAMPDCLTGEQAACQSTERWGSNPGAVSAILRLRAWPVFLQTVWSPYERHKTGAMHALMTYKPKACLRLAQQAIDAE